MLNKFRQPISQDKRGAAALLLVTILGMVALLMAIGASRLSLGEIEMGYNEQKGAEAFSAADGCAEDALLHLHYNVTYTGGSLTQGNGTCIITVARAGNLYTIDATGIVDSYRKKIEITLAVDNSMMITINSWKEVSP